MRTYPSHCFIVSNIIAGGKLKETSSPIEYHQGLVFCLHVPRRSLLSRAGDLQRPPPETGKPHYERGRWQ